jgi:hypothetical protein
VVLFACLASIILKPFIPCSSTYICYTNQQPLFTYTSKYMYVELHDVKGFKKSTAFIKTCLAWWIFKNIRTKETNLNLCLYLNFIQLSIIGFCLKLMKIMYNYMCRTPRICTMKTTVFWVVAPCSLIEVYQRFKGPCCLHHLALQPRREAFSYTQPWEKILLNMYSGARLDFSQRDSKVPPNKFIPCSRQVNHPSIFSLAKILLGFVAFIYHSSRYINWGLNMHFLRSFKLTDRTPASHDTYRVIEKSRNPY